MLTVSIRRKCTAARPILHLLSEKSVGTDHSYFSSELGCLNMNLAKYELRFVPFRSVALVCDETICVGASVGVRVLDRVLVLLQTSSFC